jgi:hypothetical protein
VRRAFQGLLFFMVVSSCSRGPEGSALKVVVTVDAEALSDCVRVEASSKGAVFSTLGMPRKDRLEVAVVGSAALSDPVTLIARGFVGAGCDEPQQLNLESTPLETTFQQGKVREVTLELHAPGPEADVDRDGYRAGLDCDDGRVNVRPGGTESCGDGLDDDCDGLIDCAQPSCANAGPPERCDGLDNDCDGMVDEGFSLGYLCTAGMSTCARDGRIVCASDALSSTCSELPDLTRAMPEVCNGADDDCDGTPDNGFALGSPCQLGLGVCARSGVLVCVDGGAAGCSVAPDAASAGREVCDGLDNDCDGQVDQRPQCGGPSVDVAETLSDWGVSEAVGDVVAPCSDATLGLVSLASETAAPYVVAGASAVRVNYGPSGAAYFAARYPAARDAGWDLSTRTGLSMVMSGMQPSTYGGWSPAAPTVILCGRDGGYRQLDPLTPLLPADGGSVALQVPLRGDGGWSSIDVGPFDLSTVDSFEVHADPARGAGTGTCSLWLDDAHFY